MNDEPPTGERPTVEDTSAAVDGIHLDPSDLVVDELDLVTPSAAIRR